jgi:hypothetical protein
VATGLTAGVVVGVGAVAGAAIAFGLYQALKKKS